MRCYNNHRRETNPSLLPYKGELQMKQKNYHSHARCEIPTRIYREKKMKQIILNTIIKRIVKEEVGDEFITKEREKKIWNDYKPFISFQSLSSNLSLISLVRIWIVSFCLSVNVLVICNPLCKVIRGYF